MKSLALIPFVSKTTLNCVKLKKYLVAKIKTYQIKSTCKNQVLPYTLNTFSFYIKTIVNFCKKKLGTPIPLTTILDNKPKLQKENKKPANPVIALKYH